MSTNSHHESTEQVKSNSAQSLPEWLQSPWMPKLSFVVVLLICYGISVNVRYQQLETWRANPQQFFVGEQPLMTTLDAPYWLRWAKEYRDGEYFSYDDKRSYPSGTPWFREPVRRVECGHQRLFTNKKLLWVGSPSFQLLVAYIHGDAIAN